MSKANGINKSTFTFTLALEAWIARTELPPKPEEDVVFSVYLRAQETPQAYRYLRKWLADDHGEAGLTSYKDLALSLSEEVILARVKGKSLDDLTVIVSSVQHCRRDLTKAFKAYTELLSNGKATKSDASSETPKPGGKVVRQARKGSSAEPSVGRKASLAEGGS